MYAIAEMRTTMRAKKAISIGEGIKSSINEPAGQELLAVAKAS